MHNAEPGRITGYIERCQIEGAVLTLGGWAFGRAVPVRGIDVVFATKGYIDRVAATCSLLRLDVGAHHGADAALSGFVATGLVVLEPGTLYLDVSHTDDREHRLRVGEVVADPVSGEPTFRPEPDEPLLEASMGPFRASLTFGRLAPARYAARAIAGMPSAKRVPGPPARPVSILASIFEGAEFLPAFFAGLRDQAIENQEIIIVDNGNAPPLASEIARRAAELPHCRLVRRDVNEGYIRGICAAFEARSLRGHAVVLNSDLEFPAGWLRRLLWPLDNLDRVATATPFTNAGTSCSFPLPEIDNDLFLGLDVGTIDRAFQSLDPERTVVPLPSGVGFCMALHADAIATIGWFDAETFGFGYGEENDWCMRARAHGWRDVLVPNLFVYHRHGGVYPAAVKRALLQRNLETIARRYPAYFHDVAEYFRTDPAAVPRAVVAFKLGAAASGRPVRCLAAQSGSACDDTLRELAGGDPTVLVIFDEQRRAWSAVLAAAGHRWSVWGWGEAEAEALRTLVTSPSE